MVEWAEFWLSDMDSNHDKGLQRALCYHYTIGQTDIKIPFPVPVAKKNSHLAGPKFNRIGRNLAIEKQSRCVIMAGYGNQSGNPGDPLKFKI
jgi:hypothetical protein